MSDTPISNAAASTTMFIDREPVVEIKICRTLERKLQKAQADVAAMREALTKERAAIARFLVPWRSHLDQSWLDNFVESGSVRFNEIGYVFPVEVSTNAGHELLAELKMLRDNLAKAQAQCAELRSEVEKAWKEGSNYGQCNCSACTDWDKGKWKNSHARKNRNRRIQMKSTCCKATFHVESSGVTCWYECDACGKSCDVCDEEPTMSYPLTSIIEVRESSNTTITGIARQPMFPLDRIKIEEKTYEVREMSSEGMKEGTVRFVALRVG